MSDTRKAIEAAMEGKTEEVEETIEENTEEVEEIEALDGESEELEEEVEVSDEEEGNGLHDEEEDFEERDTSAEEELEPIQAPQFWHAANKQAFDQLPRDLQEQVVKVDKERQAYTTQLEQKASTLEGSINSVNQVLAPYQDVIVQNGGDPVKYIQSLFYWDSHIRNSPVEGILRLMHTNGVQLSELAEQEQYVDPHVREQEQRIETLEQTIERQKAQQEQALVDQFTQEAVAFREETDESGNYLRPHLQEERVRDFVTSLTLQFIQENPRMTLSEGLQEAYELTVARYKLDAPTSPKPKPKPEKKQVSIKEAKSKKVASSVTGSGTGKSPKTKARGTRAALEASIEELGINI